MIGEWKDPRKEFGRAVGELAEQDERIVVLSADSGKSAGFGEFAKKHPDRYFEFGIMEQGVTGIASGLATTGKIPVFCAIAPFVTCRNYEMFRNDLGYMRQNVKIVGRNGGFTYSDLGTTHHSLEDYAIMRMIPGVVVLAPQDPTEIRSAAKAMLEHEGPVYMRIGGPKIPVLFEDRPFEIGKGAVLQEGGDVTVVTTGYIASVVMDAVRKVEKEGVSVELIGMPTVWPADRELILRAAAKTGRVVTVEEHYEVGGLGSIVSEVCGEGCPVPVKRIGLPLAYCTTGPYDQLCANYHLDAEGIARSILKFVR